MTSSDFRPRRGWPFQVGAVVVLGGYAVLVAAMLGALVANADGVGWGRVFFSAELRFSLWHTLAASTGAAAAAVLAGVPMAHLFLRHPLARRGLIGVLVELPLVVPPVVTGLGLLLLVQRFGGAAGGGGADTTLGVMLAQFVIGTALAVRLGRGVLGRIPRGAEDAARVLGASPGEVFWRVTLPSTRRGWSRAGLAVWARCVGEFGPVLMIGGVSRMRTEVLPTSIFIELSRGETAAAAAAGLLLVLAALGVVLALRLTEDGEEAGDA